MKKIIDGKLYDTSLSVKLAEDGFGCPRDVGYWCEKLYRTTNGTYFLFCEGGYRSCYQKKIEPNTYTIGRQIQVLSKDEARAWMEEHADADAYIAEFGLVEEG